MKEETSNARPFPVRYQQPARPGPRIGVAADGPTARRQMHSVFVAPAAASSGNRLALKQQTPTAPALAAANVPSMLDLPAAAHLLGIGRTLAYQLVRTGEWPTPVVRIGRLIKIPSGPLMDLLATGTLPTAAPPNS